MAAQHNLESLVEGVVSKARSIYTDSCRFPKGVSPTIQPDWQDLRDNLMVTHYNGLQQAYNFSILKDSLELAADLHSGHTRKKDGSGFIVHPIQVFWLLTQFDHDIDAFIGGLLHDVVEEGDERRINDELSQGTIVAEQIKEKRTEYRGIILKDLQETLTRLYSAKPGFDQLQLGRVMLLVNTLSRFKTSDQSYYSYIESIFTDRPQAGGQRLTKIVREQAITIKLADRIADLFDANRFPSGERLYRVWKNIYVINRTLEYLNTAEQGDKDQAMRCAVDQLISHTLAEAKSVAKYLSTHNYHTVNRKFRRDTRSDMQRYENKGWLDFVTPKDPKAAERFRRFDGTVHRYSDLIFEDEGMKRVLGENKRMQYENATAFIRILEKYQSSMRDPITGNQHWTIHGLHDRSLIHGEHRNGDGNGLSATHAKV